MGIKSLYSRETNVDAAVEDIKNQAGENANPKGVVFFASSNYEPLALSEILQATFKGASCIGCSTAGEIVSGKMLTGSLVVMLLDDDIVEDMCVEFVPNVQTENNVAAAFERIGEHFSSSVAALPVDEYVGLVLIDGMTGAEEKLMDTIGNLTDLTFIGGSAGDDLKFKETFVFANGQSASNAAVLGVLKLKKGFDVIKSQSFDSTDKFLKATKVNEAERRVIEFNDKPALQAYAEAIGCTEEEAANRFMHNPVGLMVGEEPYIRSPQQVDGEDMIFYCNIKEGMNLQLMESRDIVEDTKKDVEEKLSALGHVSGIIDFHCILRTLELREKNQCEAYGEIFSNVPAIGYSTYGEEYIGHINQTSTMLVFK